MKNFIKKLIVLTLVVSFAMPLAIASAAPGITTEGQRLLDALEDANIPARFINQARTHLMRAEVNPSRRDVDQVIDNINEASRLIEAEGFRLSADNPNARFTEWSTGLQERVLALVASSAAIFGLTLDLDLNRLLAGGGLGEITILDRDGNVVGNNRPPINQTGLNATASMASMLMLTGAVGGTVLVSKKRKS